jgi:hypothetical protein
MKSVSLPESIIRIEKAGFMQGDDHIGAVHGLTEIVIPSRVISIGDSAFWGTEIKSLHIPSMVGEIGKYACRDCYRLESVVIEGIVVGSYMFTNCTRLKSLTLTKNLMEFGEHALNYCEKLETINFLGKLSEWKSVKKGVSWDGHGGNNVSQSGLKRVQCTDGYMEYDSENNEWKEVVE